MEKTKMISLEEHVKRIDSRINLKNRIEVTISIKGKVIGGLKYPFQVKYESHEGVSMENGECDYKDQNHLMREMVADFEYKLGELIILKTLNSSNCSTRVSAYSELNDLIAANEKAKKEDVAVAYYKRYQDLEIKPTDPSEIKFYDMGKTLLGE